MCVLESRRRKNLVLLGATGSIGRNAIDVLRRFRGRFRLIGAAAHSNVEEMARLIGEFEVPRAAMFREDKAAELRAMLNGRCEVLAGTEGVATLAGDPEADTVISAIVGAAGLLPTLRAIESGKRVAIANKEPLVMAGAIMRAAADRHGAEILPIDSEHSAVFQAMRSGARGEVRRILLTASGGPFRDAGRETMARATAKEALNHPTWNMGAKITVDSATLMNKALEIIEAHWLFGAPYDAIEVVIHPQSIVHSMVEFRDGSVVAQMGLPDMRLPIQYALTYPDRLDGGLPPLTLDRMSSLDFMPPDRERFPSLDFAYEAGRRGGVAPAVLNAANEEAVKLFLAGKIGFLDIFDRIEDALRTLDINFAGGVEPSLDEILAADRWARERVASK